MEIATPEPGPRPRPPAPEDSEALEMLVVGSPRGQARIGLVLKRTYVVLPHGNCVVAEEDEQEVVIEDECVYEEKAPPLVSPIMYDCDLLAFREMTDLVIQGTAHTYGVPQTETQVRVQVREWYRDIRVHGDRTPHLDARGQLRFGDPTPFLEMPIRYDRAYGGVDVEALERHQTPFFKQMVLARPEMGLDTSTPFHYARNPCGRGFVIEVHEDNVGTLLVPNLEFPFDPVTPERMAVEHPDAWFQAPLPAAMDWQGLGWFPRIGYLGGLFGPEDPATSVAEIRYGWAAPDLFDIPRLTPTSTFRPEMAQAASAGMSFMGFAADELVELTNLHPEQPRVRLRLPGEIPDVRMGFGIGALTPLEPHLNAVVIRPDADEVVMIWCASIALDRPYTPVQVETMERRVEWRLHQSVGGRP